MSVVTGWTGRSACTLQSALRMTNEAFAEHLGVAVRTVSRWHARPEIEPGQEIQSALDTALERCAEAARQRFDSLNTPASNGQVAESLRVAIAVVIHDGKVLLVCRRESAGGIRWQFPAGMCKPGSVSADVAVRETLAETGVHCSTSTHLGTRLHPQTHVHCDYWLCEYLTGQVENRDPVENLDVVWCPIADLARFIRLETVYPPILDVLEAS